MPGRRAAGALASRLEALNARVDRAVFAVVVAAVAAMFLVVVAQVFCRYVLNFSLVWAEEAARYLLVLTTFLGASAAMRRGAHLGVSLVVERLWPTARRFVEALVQIVGCLVYAVLILEGTSLARQNFDQASPALGLPLGLVYLMIPLAGLLLGLQSVQRLAAVAGAGTESAPALRTAVEG